MIFTTLGKGTGLGKRLGARRGDLNVGFYIVAWLDFSQ